MKHASKVIFFPLVVLLLAGCQLLPFPLTTPTTSATVATPTLSPLSNAPGSSLDLQNQMVAIYQRVNPGVVSVFVENATSGGLGSGFVYDTLGHIITNAHVVQDMTSIEADFPSGLKAPATLVGIDLDSDIAVIKVDVPASELVPLTLGDSSKVQVGQIAIAIGSPLYNYNSMTQGIISAIGRVMDSLHSTASGGFFTTGDMLQTDAAINLGNSGGPLLDINGNVIGINRAIQTVNNGPTVSATAEPGNIGIGFAIPINIAKRVVPFLIEDGSYSYPYLGITSIENLGLGDLKLLGMQPFTGLYITSVTPGGPADKAGIKAGTVATSNPTLPAGGDIITAIDGITITSYSQFITYLVENKSPGDTVVLTILRDQKTLEVTVTLGSRPK